MQLYHALKLRDVDTALLILPGSFHVTTKPVQIVEEHHHVVRWFKPHEKTITINRKNNSMPTVNRSAFLQATSGAALLPFLGTGSMVLAQDATSLILRSEADIGSLDPANPVGRLTASSSARSVRPLPALGPIRWNGSLMQPRL